MPPRPIHSHHVPLLLCFFLLLASTLTTASPIHPPLPNNSTATITTSTSPQMDILPHWLRTPFAANDTSFLSAFTQSFLLILACELGDRTFFVAAILAMKSSRITVWAGALAALAAMTVLSAVIGKAFPLLLDKRWTGLAAALLFAYFGVQLLREWWKLRKSQPDENEELAEVEEELNHDDAAKKSHLARGVFAALFSPVFVKAFTMTGLAEWGDRSQIATIALAASRDLNGVIAGGVLGHAICTGLAVVGGRLLATKISEKAVALIGGLLFISFAVITASGKLD